MSISIIEGRVWKFGDNITTDYIMPGFGRGGTPEEMASFCMRANRPEFAREVRPGDVIVAGKNFGCGSSRPAAANLITLGVGCVLAESFGRIFFRNSINLGFPLLVCKGIHEGIHEGDLVRVNFENGEIKNISTGKIFKAEPLPEIAVRILSEGGIIALLKQEYGHPKNGPKLEIERDTKEF